MVTNPSSFPEVLWAFHDILPKIGDNLKATLHAGLDRNRVTFYSGVDCHEFFPQLYNNWATVPPTYLGNPSTVGKQNEVEVTYQSRRVYPLSLKKLECDRPPGIEAWVGREAELRALETSVAKVVIICGIGGQGKSMLAAKYLTTVSQGETSYEYWDWRDCKEEGDRIRTQLISLIERISGNDIPAAELEKVGEADLIEIFINLATERRGVFVFDNVDYYVDLEHSVFIGFLDTLVRSFSRSESTSRIIITCRPNIAYDAASVITLSVMGLELGEAVELFAQRAGSLDTPHQDIAAAHERTKGHAFWLDLMAVQVARVPGVTLRKLLEDIRRGRDDTPDLLSSIWDTLAEREKIVLRAMAETVRPETEEMVKKIVSTNLNYQKFKKALKSLISLNLIVVKPEINSPDLYDLHPLVRQFIRRSFDRLERAGFIQTVIHQYVVIINGFKALLGVHLPFGFLERCSQKAELEIEAGLYQEAFITLSEIDDALIGGGYAEEFVRVARKLFEAVDWETSSSKITQFDDILANVISCLDELEEYTDADDMLRRYEETVPSKTARYIKYCEVRCHSYWTRGQHTLAVEWGTRANDLKTQSDVDIAWELGHSLALARRDGGDAQGALNDFLGSRDLDDITAASSKNAYKGALCGNVGRCLQMMGNLEKALICFRKSARALENDNSRHRLSNHAYARQWVAEIFVSLGKKDLAWAFYMDAENLLKKTAPVRARALRSAMDALYPTDAPPSITLSAARKCVHDWIHVRAD